MKLYLLPLKKLLSASDVSELFGNVEQILATHDMIWSTLYLTVGQRLKGDIALSPDELCSKTCDVFMKMVCGAHC